MKLAVRKSDNEVINERGSTGPDLAYIAQRYGGDPGDYELVTVPSNEESQVYTARYITYDGESFSYVQKSLVVLDETTVTISEGWVKGIKHLAADEEIDLSGDLPLAEEKRLYVDIAEDDVSGEIEVFWQLVAVTEDYTPPVDHTVLLHAIFGAYCANGMSDCRNINLENQVEE